MLRNNGFLYLSGSLITFMGDALYTFIISWWLIQETNDTKLLGIVLSVSILPAVILNIITGNLIDRFDKKTIMIFSDLCSGLVCISAFFFLDSKYFVQVIIVTTFFLYLFNNVFSISSKSILKFLFKEDDLLQVNSYQTSIKQLSKVIAPVIGGFLILTIDPRIFVLLNGITFCISALLETKLSYVKKPEQKFKSKMKFLDLNIIKLIKEQGLMSMITFIMLNNFFLAAITIYIPYMVVTQFKAEEMLGLTFALQAIGAISSTLVLKYIKSEISYEFLAILASLSLLLCSYNIYLLLIGLLLFGLFVTMFNIKFITFLQIKTPDHMIGRVFSILISLGLLLVPIGNFTFGLIGASLGKYCITIIGLCLLTINTYYYLNFKRRVKLISSIQKNV